MLAENFLNINSSKCRLNSIVLLMVKILQCLPVTVRIKTKILQSLQGPAGLASTHLPRLVSHETPTLLLVLTWVFLRLCRNQPLSHWLKTYALYNYFKNTSKYNCIEVSKLIKQTVNIQPRLNGHYHFAMLASVIFFPLVLKKNKKGT